MNRLLIFVLSAIAVSPAFAQDALFVDASGDVGVGTNSPNTSLHVQRDAGARVLVQDTVPSGGNRVMFYLKGAGTGKVRFLMQAANGTWSFNSTGTAFTIGRVGDPDTEFRVNNAGNLVIAGTLSEGSSRSIKDRIVPVDAQTVLAKVEQLPIAEWSYETALGTRHIGPMAEEFYALFGVGPDNKHIAPKDMAGVALAAVKALTEKVEVLQKRIEELEEKAVPDVN